MPTSLHHECPINLEVFSDAEKLINEVPVIEVEGHVAVCDGGSGALGHPIEYIQLDTISNEPQICKYCGLRYKMAHH